MNHVLAGQTAVVTGASRGIGLAMARALARAGADVVAVSRDPEPARAAVEAEGRTCTVVACDLGQRDEVEGLASRILGLVPQVDILVNNAGLATRSPAEDTTLADWDRVIATNLSAPFILTRDLGGPMLARKRGKVVFTASMLSFQGGLYVLPYTAAKSGIAGLVRAFSNEWAPRGVNVNGIAPGYVATEITAALRSDPMRSRQILERIPAGRWSEPEDLAEPLVFLCSSGADYLHGSILTVDGGWLGR